MTLIVQIFVKEIKHRKEYDNEIIDSVSTAHEVCEHHNCEIDQNGPTAWQSIEIDIRK